MLLASYESGFPVIYLLIIYFKELKCIEWHDGVV